MIPLNKNNILEGKLPEFQKFFSNSPAKHQKPNLCNRYS